MSVRFKINTRTGFYISLSITAGFAVSATYAFAQYAQMASNTAPQGMARMATIQECAKACAANMACGSFVYYTQSTMANVCQLTSSQKPLNINGAISGVPLRNIAPVVQQQPVVQSAKNTLPLRKTPETPQANFQAQPRGPGNYSVTPLANSQPANMAANIAANVPNRNPAPMVQQQYQPPQQVQQSGAISFVRPDAIAQQTMQPKQQQPSQLQKYNPPPQYQPTQYQQQASYQPQTVQPPKMQQQVQQQYTPQPMPQPMAQMPQYSPQPVSQEQLQKLATTQIQPQQYYSPAQSSPPQNDVNYQSHSRQAVPEYSVARATEQANQQIMQNKYANDAEISDAKPIREANAGPLRPPLKTQMEYDKYRDKDGMVDAAAMRRDMLKNEKSPRYSVESEWAEIAKNTDANQAAKVYENSAPIPLPAEINEKDILTEDKADTQEQKPKKKGLFSKMFKRELDEYAEPAVDDNDNNNQNAGPLRRK